VLDNYHVHSSEVLGAGKSTNPIKRLHQLDESISSIVAPVFDGVNHWIPFCTSQPGRVTIANSNGDYGNQRAHTVVSNIMKGIAILSGKGQ
jgi:hypothetical protein